MFLKLNGNMELSDRHFELLADKINDSLGIHFAKNKKKDLERALLTAFRDSDSENWERFIAELANNNFSEDKIFWLAKYLTIGETYFFRENKINEVFFEKIFKIHLENGKQEFLFWSVACATGEEPFSLAMEIHDKFPEAFERTKIYATDINHLFLKKAKRGIYRAWSFRNTSSYYKNKYFDEEHEGYFKIKDFIKNKVSFHYLNLADRDYRNIFAKHNYFDYIFFRNAMIYFSKTKISHILNNLYKSLKDGGYLVTSIAELAFMSNNRKFNPVNFDSVRVFRKNSEFNINQLNNNIVLTEKRTFEKKEIQSTFKFSDRNKEKEAFGEKIIRKESVEKLGGNFSYSEMKEFFANEMYESFIEGFESFVTNSELDLYSSEEKDNLMFWYCKSLANLGRIEEAAKRCEDFLLRNKLNYRLHELAAQLDVTLGQPLRALKHLDKALYLKPDSPLLYFLRANIFNKLNKKLKAEKDLSNVLKILTSYKFDAVIEEADGLTAGMLKEISLSLLNKVS